MFPRFVLFLVQNISQTSFPKILSTLQSDFASQFTIRLRNAQTFCTVEREFGRFFRSALITAICKQVSCNFQKYFDNVLAYCAQNFIKIYQTQKELFKDATSGFKKKPCNFFITSPIWFWTPQRQ